jgi:hypothetical protein
MKESMPLNYTLFKFISILAMVESLFKFVVKGGLAGAVAATTAPANPDKVGRVQDLRIKYTRKWPVAPLIFVVVYFCMSFVWNENWMSTQNHLIIIFFWGYWDGCCCCSCCKEMSSVWPE